MRIARRDDNERQILNLLTNLGVWWYQMPRDAGFDLLLAWRSRLYIVEIKNDGRNQSARRLTPNEIATQMALTAVGVEYHVAENADDVLSILEVRRSA